MTALDWQFTGEGLPEWERAALQDEAAATVAITQSDDAEGIGSRRGDALALLLEFVRLVADDGHEVDCRLQYGERVCVCLSVLAKELLKEVELE